MTQPASKRLLTEAAANNAYTTPAAVATLTAGKLDKSEAASAYNKRGATASPHQIGAVIHKMQAGVESIVVTALGDSTGAMAGSWLNGLFSRSLVRRSPTTP
ncbi:hypothetical protein AHiyo6_05830 [Arthrobacter sp. Hiyo6]|nr:hypothetical protein AHiyo6_05830 [Arthrobacter sp. Hiyo6]